MYYTQPTKEKSVWVVNKMNSDGKREMRHEFGSKLLANEFLETINIYIDGKLVYSGV